MLADMCNCAWVPFSSRVKPKHGILTGYQHITFYPDEKHYQKVCENFLLTNSICDFLLKKTVQCWFILVIFYIKQLGKTSIGGLIQTLKINNPAITNNFAELSYQNKLQKS